MGTLDEHYYNTRAICEECGFEGLVIDFDNEESEGHCHDDSIYCPHCLSRNVTFGK